MQDEKLAIEVHKIMNGEIGENFNITQDEVLTMKGRMCVSDIEDLRRLIMQEAHCSTYAMYSDSTKMYRTIKENYWWSGMKKDIVKFVSKCLVCQQVKAEHQKLARTFHLLPIPKWKWKHIIMDFLIGLPHTWIDYDAIWVIMD